MLQLNRAGSSAQTKQIKDWIKKYLPLSDRFTIFVTESKCAEPGCPPVETLVALFGSSGLKYQRKLPLSIKDITELEAKRLAKLLHQDIEQQYTDQQHTNDQDHKESCEQHYLNDQDNKENCDEQH